MKPSRYQHLTLLIIVALAFLSCAKTLLDLNAEMVGKFVPAVTTEQDAVRIIGREPQFRSDLGMGIYALVWQEIKQSPSITIPSRQRIFAYNTLATVFDERQTLVAVSEYLTFDEKEKSSSLPIRDYHVRRESHFLTGEILFHDTPAKVFRTFLKTQKERGYKVDTELVDKTKHEATNMTATVGANPEGVRLVVTSVYAQSEEDGTRLIIRSCWKKGSQNLGAAFVLPEHQWGFKSGLAAIEYLVNKELGLPMPEYVFSEEIQNE